MGGPKDKTPLISHGRRGEVRIKVMRTRVYLKAASEDKYIYVYVSFQFFVSRLRPFLTPPKTALEKKFNFFWRILSIFIFLDAFLSIFFFVKRVLGEMRQNKRVLEEMHQKFLSHFYGLFLGGSKMAKNGHFLLRKNWKLTYILYIMYSKSIFLGS